MEREGLSAMEEAMAIQDAVDVERKLDSAAPAGDLIEKVGVARGLNAMVARNLVGLLKSPRSLQSAVMARAIGREVAFELARHWNKMLAENDLHGGAKREIQFRNLVEAWARSRGMELDAQAMAVYAADTFQAPRIVKASCRKADEAQQTLLERFGVVVQRAQKEGWTVARARVALAERRRSGRGRPKQAPCFEQGGPGKMRLTVHLDRIRDPARATPDALNALLDVLRGVVREIEAGPLAPGERQTDDASPRA